ncbi:alginate lyase [Endozoicomonas elysicola]|uniref:Alginate lyase n=2 Tax=Endozoicomonas elysicola TaxID=305900 RepID=A0A081KCM3_9GAMM|nr:alginate lyase [Endozoicomonas elysicola]
MMMKMKKHCQQCQAKTDEADLAFICSFECTFCSTCADHQDFICPNCNGELLQRPRRTRTPLDVSLTQMKRKLFGK